MPSTPPLVGLGEVRHHRLRPVQHRFRYPTWFLLLPMRSLRAEPCEALRRNTSGWASFHDSDHGEGGPDALAWLEKLMVDEGVLDADGEVWLQTYPRVLGYTFKPVSFWYCHRVDGSLRAIVVEVNNTFGERHIYLLDGPEVVFGHEITIAKVFHVSPFCAVEGQYRFRFMRTSDRIVARIEHDDATGPLLLTSISGHLVPLTTQTMRTALCRMPLLTLGVIVRIHWQALKLWRRKVPFFRKPEPPKIFTTRSS